MASLLMIRAVSMWPGTTDTVPRTQGSMTSRGSAGPLLVISKTRLATWVACPGSSLLARQDWCTRMVPGSRMPPPPSAQRAGQATGTPSAPGSAARATPRVQNSGEYLEFFHSFFVWNMIHTAVCSCNSHRKCFTAGGQAQSSHNAKSSMRETFRGKIGE